MHPKLVPLIIDTLETLYGRPEIIIKTLMTDIRDYPPIKPERLDLFMKFAFEVQNVCTIIESLKRENHLNDQLLIEDLVENLPTQEKKDWARYKVGKRNITLKTLSIWLYDLAKLISTVTTPVLSKPSNKKVSGTEKIDINEKAAGLERVNVHVESKSPSGKDSKGKQRKFPCPVCKSECSEIEQCPKFKSFDVDNRLNIVKENKLCRICIRRHKGFCRINAICGKNGCQYRHNSLLHNDERHSPPKNN